jgi:hypothetical protein
MYRAIDLPPAGSVSNGNTGGLLRVPRALTGDDRVTGEAIARTVGIDGVHAELLP